MTPEEIAAFLDSLRDKLDPADMAKLEQLFAPSDDDDLELAADDPPPTPGTPRPLYPFERSNPAMDSKQRLALDAAVRSAGTSTIARYGALLEAKQDVEPHVGKIAIACDSAEAVYKAALTSMGIPTAGIHSSAYRLLFQTHRRNRANGLSRPAMDSAAVDSYAEMFPGAIKAKNGF
jgi:hypothetical protein